MDTPLVDCRHIQCKRPAVAGEVFCCRLCRISGGRPVHTKECTSAAQLRAAEFSASIGLNLTATPAKRDSLNGVVGKYVQGV